MVSGRDCVSVTAEAGIKYRGIEVGRIGKVSVGRRAQADFGGRSITSYSAFRTRSAVDPSHECAVPSGTAHCMDSDTAASRAVWVDCARSNGFSDCIASRKPRIIVATAKATAKRRVIFVR